VVVICVVSALRIGLAVVRDPFFDELASAWFAAKPMGEHWRFLLEDSGPPLFYALARLVYLLGGASVDELRTISLVAALLTLGLLLAWECGSPARSGEASRLAADKPANGLRHTRTPLVAAALLAVFPPHVYFSTEARGYALAALFVGVATVSLYRWHQENRSTLLWAGTISLVLAGYTHWYGVLFFPLPLVLGLLARDRRRVLAGFSAAASAGLLFIPGFWLASQQPLESIAWMRTETVVERLRLVFGSLLQLGFAAPYPAVFLSPPPPALLLVSVMLVAPVAVWGLWTSREARIFGIATVLPVLIVAGLAVAGRTFYFPMRFESVLSIPFVLWLGFSWAVMRRGIARAWLAATLILGLVVSASAIADHLRRPLDPYRQVAELARQRIDEQTPIVASGYAYLEIVSKIGPEWRPLIAAFPQRQALHPGWRASVPAGELRAELESLPDSFVWIGTLHSVEAQLLGERYKMQQLFSSGPVVAAAAERRL
jgi:hypothetical protein